ncbi:helix-turn-helix transcriptional regulator [Pandoraea sp. B-6]|uniref:helix-turn-helix transcriptional regulator n=1 Tax=unclassified Pandoraea TaxID=2624094 RepID=UPI00350F2812
MPDSGNDCLLEHPMHQTLVNEEQTSIVFLRRSDVERIAGLSRSSIYAKMKDGQFPKPVHLSSRMVRWIESEVLAWAREKIAVGRTITVSDQSVA